MYVNWLSAYNKPFELELELINYGLILIYSVGL